MFKNLVKNNTIPKLITNLGSLDKGEPWSIDSPWYLAMRSNSDASNLAALPIWKEGVPSVLQEMAFPVIELTARFGSLFANNTALDWSQLSLKLEALAVQQVVENIHGDFHRGIIQKVEFEQKMLKVENLSNEHRIDLLIDFIKNNPELCRTTPELEPIARLYPIVFRPAQALAGRALIFFDEAVTLWETDRTERFLNTLSNAIYLADYATELSDQFTAEFEAWIEGEPHNLSTPSPEEAEKHALTEMARKGGEGKKAKYQPLKELAIQLVSEGNFKSRRNAAISVTQKVIEHGRRIGIPLSEDQATQTITGWLKDAGLPANISR